MSNRIHPTAIIDLEKVKIGKNVYIGPYCTIGNAPEHKDSELNDKEGHGVVIIEDNVVIRSHVNIDCGTIGGATIIREGSYIMAHSHIGHDARIGKMCTLASGSIIGGHSIIEDYANIGLGAVLHQFTEVGEGTIVGGLNFAKGKLAPWSKYHTGIKAINQGPNEHLIKKLGIKVEDK